MDYYNPFEILSFLSFEKKLLLRLHINLISWWWQICLPLLYFSFIKLFWWSIHWLLWLFQRVNIWKLLLLARSIIKLLYIWRVKRRRCIQMVACKVLQLWHFRHVGFLPESGSFHWCVFVNPAFNTIGFILEGHLTVLLHDYFELGIVSHIKFRFIIAPMLTSLCILRFIMTFLLLNNVLLILFGWMIAFYIILLLLLLQRLWINVLFFV